MSEYEQLTSKFRRLVELRTTRDEDKKTAETSEKEYREYEAELFDEIDESPMTGPIRLDLGEFGTFAFSNRSTAFGRILDHEAAANYFETRGMSDEMVQRKIPKGKLNELVRDLVEQGKPMPPGVDWYVSRGITISKRS